MQHDPANILTRQWHESAMLQSWCTVATLVGTVTSQSKHHFDVPHDLGISGGAQLCVISLTCIGKQCSFGSLASNYAAKVESSTPILLMWYTYDKETSYCSMSRFSGLYADTWPHMAITSA